MPPSPIRGTCTKCGQVICSYCIGCACKHHPGCPLARKTPAPGRLADVLMETVRLVRRCRYCRHDRPMDGTPCDTCGAPTADARLY